MKEKQVLDDAVQDISKLRREISTLKGKNTKNTNLINELATALESLKRQYENMLSNNDDIIASQAEKIKELENENKRLHKRFKEIKRDIA